MYDMYINTCNKYYAIHTSHLTGIAENVRLDVVTATSRGVLLKVARKYSLP